MLLLKNIAQVATLRGGPAPRCGTAMADIGIVENGAILIRGQHIQWVGDARDLRKPGEDCQTIDGAGLELLALPGFVDSHTHPIFAGTRAQEYELRCLGKTYQEIAASGGGIQASVRQVRAASRTQLVEAAERFFQRFLEHGTTTIEAKSGYGLSLHDELKILEAIAELKLTSRLETVPTFLGAHAIPEEHKSSR